MTRTGECACEQGWDQIQTNLQEWSWAGEQALSSRQLNNRGFPLIFLRVIGETGKTWDSFCLPIKRGEETTRRQRTVSRSPFEDDLLDPASTGQYVNIYLIDFDIDLSCF